MPKTRLGAVGLKLAVATSTATIQIIATSTYVNALTALAAPVITFRAVPPGTTIPMQSLQTAYIDFTQQLSAVQGQAAAWISTSASSGGASIFSNLVAIAGMFSNIDATVQGEFVLLQTLTPGSAAWQNALAEVKVLIGAEVDPLTSVETQITTLSPSWSASSAW